MADREYQRTLPQLVDYEAEGHGLSPILLAALIASESRCKQDADSGNGDIGLGQIRIGGSAAMGNSRRWLLKPWMNVNLTARHLSMWLRICDGYVLGALSGYRGLKGCKSSKGSRRVMQLFEKAKNAEVKS